MFYSKERTFFRWFITFSSLVIIGLFLWNVSIFFEKIKEEERNKMEILGSAYSEISRSDNDDNINDVIVEILSSNSTTPMIVYGVNDESYSSRNIPDEDIDSLDKKLSLIEDFKTQYDPIEVYDGETLVSIVYYGYSDLLIRLKYFPIIIILIILLFLGVIYYFFSTSKSHEQSQLWAGMAKETAHQIGTPLSSLVGWTEILRSENVNPDYLIEIEKDVSRLQTITERFSKIGSLPKLEPTNIIKATQDSYDYLKARSSRLINFEINLPSHEIIVDLNEELYSWTIENLVKNAIDALKGKGDIKIEMYEEAKWVHILITDNGKGIPKSLFKKIFSPGVTSKKRGWGLGLSLAKRIIETYHEGKIKVLKSEINQGTTFEIRLQKKVEGS
ncbi:sensor histidine kinase [Mesonia sp.]|uniref:sensor histidine kinase n=1 Tax=Mesonia sp. TaxID=1960830 RepID=UPI003F97F402